MRLMVLAPLLLLPMPAAAFTAQNGMTATQISPTEIAVAHDVRRDDTDYWCAAGDFVRRVLGQPGNTRIWRATPKPREAGRGSSLRWTPHSRQRARACRISVPGSGTALCRSAWR